MFSPRAHWYLQLPITKQEVLDLYVFVMHYSKNGWWLRKLQNKELFVWVQKWYKNHCRLLILHLGHWAKLYIPCHGMLWSIATLTCSRWYVLEWLKVDCKPDSPLHCSIECQHRRNPMSHWMEKLDLLLRSDPRTRGQDYDHCDYTKESI